MRPLKMTLSAGAVENIFGETLKIKVRESSQDLLIKTDNDTIPCRAGDLIVLPSKVVSFTIENMGDADSDIELLLMGASGATLESSAGAVEVTNFPEPPTVQDVNVLAMPFAIEYDKLYVMTVGDSSFSGMNFPSSGKYGVKNVIVFDGPIYVESGSYVVRFEAGMLEFDSYTMPKIKSVSGTLKVVQYVFTHYAGLVA